MLECYHKGNVGFMINCTGNIEIMLETQSNYYKLQMKH